MKKLVVINGCGGVGKDTLCDIIAKHYKVRNISSITPIKNLAVICGWDGEKTPKARKFLSDLKMLTVEFNDYPTKWAADEYSKFLETDEEIMFVHIREPKEIEKFSSSVGGVAKTLLIRGGTRLNGVVYGNSSDDDVEKYNYDFIYVNDLPIEETEKAFLEFFRENILK